MAIKVAIAGIVGRMGRMLATECQAAEDFEVVGGVEYAESPYLNQSLEQSLGLIGHQGWVREKLSELPSFDLLIDFTTPAATLSHLDYCRQNKVAAVIGTTGFSELEQQLIREAASEIAIVHAHNYSVGLTILLDLVQQASAHLGPEVDTEIVEWHHNQKVDAPSGTAYALLDAVQSGWRQNNGTTPSLVHGREGVMGSRPRAEVGLHALRGGDVVGEHHVLFAASGERIELTHRASSRVNFAQGAMRAGRWLLLRQDRGLFDMRDVLDLKRP